MSQSAPTTPADQAELPASILEVLERVTRRRRNVIVFRGVLAVVGVAIGAVLALMAVDAAVTVVSSSARWMMSITALLAVVAAVAFFLVRPLSRRMTLVRIAQLVDAHHPEFEERVSSTVELLSGNNGRGGGASPALLGELTRQAIDRVRAVEPQREFNLRSVRPYFVMALSAATIMGGLWLLWPKQAQRLFSRVVMPYADLANLKADDLKVTPGDITVAIGDPLQIKVRSADAAAARAAVLQRDKSMKEVPVTMARLMAADGRSEFVVTLPRIVEPFDYRVLVDDRALSQYFSVRVTPRPTVERLDIRYEYPAYTGIASRVEEKAKGDITAPVGTTVTIAAHCNKPLAEAKLSLAGKSVAATVDREQGGQQVSARFEVTPETTGQWNLTLKDQFSLEVRTAEHKIEAVPDRAPLVVIAEPQTAELRLKPTDRLPIAYRVREDYGVSTVKLIVRAGAAKEIPIRVSLPKRSTIERGTWVGQTVLDLESLNLGNVPRIEVLVEASDTLPAALQGPQRGRSKPLAIIFDAGAQAYSAQAAEAAVRKIAVKLNEALAQLKYAKGQITAVRPNLENQPLHLPPESLKPLETARGQTAKAEELLLSVSEDNSEPALSAITTQAGRIAEDNVAPARQALELIPLASIKKDQTDKAKLSDEQIDAAIAALTKLIATLGAEQDRLARARELAAQIAALVEKQFDLRKVTEQALDKPEPTDLAKELFRRILEAQRQIAREANLLPARIAAEGLNKDGKDQMANQSATDARQAANQLLEGKVPEAAQAGQAAEKDFDKLADAVKKQPGYAPPKESRLPPVDETVKRLAERQKNVNEQLDALRKGELAKALASLQKDLAEQTKEVAERAKALEAMNPQEAMTPQKGNPQSSKDAKGTSDTLGMAVEEEAQAAADLGHIDNIPKVSEMKFIEGPQSPSDSGGNPDGGQGTQGGGSNTGAGSSKKPSPSNNNINNTIAKGKNLGKATLTAEALLNQKPSNQNTPSGGSGTELQADAEELLRKGLATIMADNNPLAKGFGGFGGGAPDTEVPPTPPKEFGAEGGEDQANDQAGKPSGDDAGGQPMGDQPPGSQPPGGKPSGGKPGGKPTSGKGGKLGTGPGRVAARIGKLGISGEDWLKLPSDLRDEVLKSSDEQAPREYRELVRQYFQAMARGANQ